MVDIKKYLENFEKQVIEINNKHEISRIMLMNNITYYSSDEIIQLNRFFESIQLLLDEEAKDFNVTGEFIKYLKINKYEESLKEIKNALDMFEKDLNSKKEENIKK